MIYLDHAATTPMSRSALDTLHKAAENFYGNPSSLHDTGSEAKRVLESSRKALAGLSGVNPAGLKFTGSGSEANFLAITSLARALSGRGNHLITTRMEHSSVRSTFVWLEEQGYEVTRLGCDSYGRVSPERLLEAIKPDTVLASIQHVNSETGAIQDLKSLGEVLKEKEIVFHTDWVQGFGKITLSMQECGVNSFSIAAHKINGPKGCGAAWIDPSLRWIPMFGSTTHEGGFRPGTIDVPAISAFAVAAQERFAGMERHYEKISGLRKFFLERAGELCAAGFEVAVPDETASPYILGLILKSMEGQYAMLECNRKGLAISTGSACRANEQQPSETLLSMGRDESDSLRLVRLSFGPSNEPEEVERAATILSEVVGKHESVLRR